MEFCEESLSKWILSFSCKGPMPESVIGTFISNIILTVDRLHNMGYAHMDIKPDNILISKKKRLDTKNGLLEQAINNPKSISSDRTSEGSSTSPRSLLSNLNYLLSDFGLCSKISHDESNFDIVEGDKAYMPLEVFSRALEPTNIIDLRKVDIFSIGLIVLQLMTAIEIPAQGPLWSSLRTKEGVAKLVENTAYSDKLKELVIRCLSPDPSERPLSWQIQASMKDKSEALTKAFESREESRLKNRLTRLRSSGASSLHLGTGLQRLLSTGLHNSGEFFPLTGNTYFSIRNSS
jgi:serine/threonine protein kinase